MRRTLALVVAIAAVLFSAPPSRLAAQETTAPSLTKEQMQRLLQRMVGTWELNLQKSKFYVGDPYKKKTVTYTASKEDPLAIDYTQKIWYADGSETNRVGVEPQFFDGKERQYTAPNLGITRQPLDEYRAEVYLTVKGMPPGEALFARNSQEVTPDGKQLTVATRRFNRQGKEIVTILQVFDKVGK